MTDKTDREIMQQALNDLEALVAYIKGGEPDLFMQVPSIEALHERLAKPDPRNQCGETCERAKLCAVCLAEMGAQPEQKPVLQDIEQYRMQMASISTAAIGYWKEGDGIHPDYDTPALRDVAMLYAKYDALYKARPDPLQRLTDVQQALEALEFFADTAICSADTKMAEEGIAALRAALAEQEPVAQMREMLEVQGRDGTWNCDTYSLGMYNGMEFMVALAEGREPVFREPPERWLHTPQKREWQGLTDEESNRLVMEHLGPHALTGGKMSVYDAFLLAIRATEAKLKEKND